MLTPEQVRSMQADVIEQLKNRFEQLRRTEKSLNEPVDSLTLEHQLGRLATKAGARKKNITHGWAAVFDNFGPEEKKELFQLLTIVEENLPQPPINWTRFMSASLRRQRDS